jgi:Lytic transglycolase
MPMPRAIGTLLVCLVTSACMTTEQVEKNPLQHPRESAGLAQDKAEATTTREWHNSPCSEPLEGDSIGSAFNRARGRVRDNDSYQFGEASWYDLVGGETASGEILDNITATAADSSLPSDSFAKVTDLDNGRSVIVKINDRGPYIGGRIIEHRQIVSGVGLVLLLPLDLGGHLLEQPKQRSGWRRSRRIERGTAAPRAFSSAPPGPGQAFTLHGSLPIGWRPSPSPANLPQT